MKELFNKYLLQTTEKFLDYLVNNIFTSSSIFGIIGFIIQTYFPQHIADYAAMTSAYLIHARGKPIIGK